MEFTGVAWPEVQCDQNVGTSLSMNGLQAGHAPWRPLLDGDDARRAIDIAQDIARAAEPIIDAQDDGALATGSAGYAVLNAYLDRALPDCGYDRVADRHLARAASLMRTRRMGADFFCGFPGIAWAVTHVDSMFRPTAPDRCGGIDDALAGFVSRTPWQGEYDLVSGVVGLGAYAMERMRRPAAVTCAEAVVARLEELAQVTDDGITWRTSARLLPEHQRQLYPEGYYNLGMAHGVPGIIALLGMFHSTGVAPVRVQPLLSGAVSWLLAQPWSDEGAAGFPGLLPCRENGEVDRTGAQSRIAWCYGDLGLSAALFAAASCVNDVAWQSAASSIARRAARRAPDDSRVVDGGLCHGAAGVGHVFNRLYQATGDETLGAAARYWITNTLDRRDPSTGVGGYRFYSDFSGFGEVSWQDDPGLLTGAIGVALALLAGATHVEPAWDRMLLLSAPGES